MVSTHREALSLFNRDVRLVLFSQALIGFTIFGGVYTVLLNLYLLRLGYGPQMIGQVNAVGALSFALLSMPAGLLANRWGARRSMIVGMVVAALGFGLLPLGEFAPSSVQLDWIMGAYALGVLGNTLFLVCSIPFLTLICPPRLRNHVFSTQVALWPLAGFAGSLCGGLLPGLFSALLSLPEDHPAPYRYPLLLAAGVLFISAGAIAATRSRPHKPSARERGEATPFPLAIVLVLSLVTFLQMAAENSLRIFFNVYMDDGLGVSTVLIGSLTAGGQLLAACTALAAPALSRRFGRVPVITGGAGAMVLCLIPLALVAHWAVAGAACMALVALSSIRRSVYIVFQQELVPEHWRVTMSSALTMAYGISIAGVSLGGGWMIDALGYRALFLCSAVITAAGVLCFQGYFRIPRGEYAKHLAGEGA